MAWVRLRFLKCIMGLRLQLRRQCTFDGVDCSSIRAEERARIGYRVRPQGREIFFTSTVEENLSVGLGVAAVTVAGTIAATCLRLVFPC